MTNCYILCLYQHSMHLNYGDEVLIIQFLNINSCRGNVEQRDQLFDIMLSEYYVQNFASCRDNITSFSDLPSEGKYSYRVDSTGATVTADSSVSLIHKYCEKLPKDRYVYSSFLLQGLFLDISYVLNS